MADPTDDPLYERVRERLERERGPLAWIRSRRTPVRLALLAAAALAALGVLLLLTGAPLRLRGTAFNVGLGGLVVLVALTMAAALRPITELSGPASARALTTAAVVLAALGAVAVGSDGAWGAVGPLRCLMVGGLVGVPVFGLALALDRTPWRGALFGALAAGLVGAVGVSLVCPSPHLAHLVVAHFGAFAVAATLFGLVGWAIARRA